MSFEQNIISNHKGYRVPPKIVFRLVGCYGGAIDLIVLIFTQLHRSGLSLVFKAMFKSGCLVVDLLAAEERHNIWLLQK